MRVIERLMSGTLILATTDGVEMWRTDPRAEVVVWDKLWDRLYKTAQNIIISPFLSHIAWYTKVTILPTSNLVPTDSRTRPLLAS